MQSRRLDDMTRIQSPASPDRSIEVQLNPRCWGWNHPQVMAPNLGIPCTVVVDVVLTWLVCVYIYMWRLYWTIMYTIYIYIYITYVYIYIYVYDL